MPPKRKNQKSGKEQPGKRPRTVKEREPLPFQDPCQYLHDTVAEMDPNIEEKSNGFLAQAENGVLSQFLVSSVILAINEIQPTDPKYTDTKTIGFSAECRPRTNQQQLIRPGRPLLFPLQCTTRGWVLLVLQFDQAGEITMHILDPTRNTFSQGDRDEIFQNALRTLEESRWNVLVPGDLPSGAVWVNTAAYRSMEDQFCFTILSAWVLVMGLTLNTAFTHDDARHANFIRDALNLFVLVDHPRFDWRLVLAFFQCYDLVLDGTSITVSGRRFGHVEYEETLTEQVQEDEVLLDLQERKKKRITGKHIGKNNQIGIPRPVPTVLPPLPTTLEEINEFLEQRNVQTSDSGNGDRENEEENRRINRDNFRLFQETFRVSDLEHINEINNNPCAYVDQKLRQYRALASEPPKQNLPNSKNSAPLYEPRAVSIEAGKGSRADNRFVSLAIASIIEAIMVHQNDDTHLGGFALATPAEYTRIARPRRVWIRPYTVSPEEQDNVQEAHTIIFITQEETSETGERVFEHHAIDSRPHILENQLSMVALRARMLEGLVEYEAHRNADSHVRMTNHYLYARNAIEDRFQSHDRWETGMIAVFNAWVPALGLTINRSARERNEEHFYARGMEIIQRALEGVMDWSTIAAFLICYNLVDENSLGQVDETRRFSASQLQTTVDDLNDRLDVLRAQDREVERNMPSEQQNPYDFSNNAQFSFGHTRHQVSNPNRRNTIATPVIIVQDEFQRKETEQSEANRQSLHQIDQAVDNSVPPFQDYCNFLRTRLDDTETRRAISAVEKDLGEAILDDPNILISNVLRAINHHQQSTGSIDETRCMGFSILDPLNASSVLRPGRPLIVARETAYGHYLLVVQLNDTGEVSAWVIDPTGSVSEDSERQQLLQDSANWVRDSGWLPSKSDSLPRQVRWVDMYGQQRERRITNLIVVLIAWAIALGLEPSVDLNLYLDMMASKQSDFFRRGCDICYLSQASRLDWRLLLAFLNCFLFLSPSDRVTPAADRRFGLVPSQDESLRQCNEEDKNVGDGQNQDLTRLTRLQFPPIFFQSFEVELEGAPPDTPSSFQSSASSDSDHNGPRLSGAPSSPTRSSRGSLAKVDRFAACQYFYTRLSRSRQRSSIKDILQAAGLEREETSWFTRRYLYFSINSVTQAMNSLASSIDAELSQDTSHSRSRRHWAIMDWKSWKLAMGLRPLGRLYPATFPNSPLIIPWARTSRLGESHSFLVVIQNERIEKSSASRRSIHVLDSGPWLSGREERGEVFNDIITLIEASGRDAGGDPEAINWISTPPHRENWESNYYTLVNAWSILLDGDINPNFQPSDSFFHDFGEVVYLSLSGQADWMLIWTFLVCSGYIADGRLPDPSRQFSRTVPKREQKRLIKVQRNQQPVSAPASPRYSRFRRGRGHSEEFPSDQWDDTDRIHRRLCLQRRNMFKSSLSKGHLLQRFYDMGEEPNTPWNRKIRDMRINLRSRGESERRLNVREVIELFARQQHNAIGKMQMALINRNICGHWKDRVTHGLGLQDIEETIISDQNEKEQPSAEFAMFAISSVVEGIMVHQNDISFRGGFALATVPAIQGARSQSASESDEMLLRCARPRRSWLMPFTVTREDVENYTEKKRSKKRGEGLPELKPGTSHTILIIYQEERLEDIEPRFSRTIIDSHPELLKTHYESVIEDADQVAVRLGWSTHRNNDQHIGFKAFDEWEDTIEAVRQSKQQMSNVHVILNAWAIALGLTPRMPPDSEVGVEDFENYDDAWTMIRFSQAGLLDWATIASFLICHDLVNEEQIQDVPRERRFHITQVQTGLSDQINRLQRLIENDNCVADEMPSDITHPYNLQNNAYSDAPSDRAENSQDDFQNDFQISLDQLPPDFDPCGYYTTAVADLRKRKDVRAWIRSSQALNKYQEAQITSEKGKWLGLGEVLLAIASVTLAITETQIIEGGFSIINSYEIATCATPGEKALPLPVSRFGRPLIIPLLHYSHLILVVVQLNRYDDITISIVDSRFWHNDRGGRQQVYEYAVRIIRSSNWYRRILTNPQIPETANWIRGPQQTDDSACGYYVIFSAWTIAMGLEIDENMVPSDTFFENALEVVTLARGGYLDWRVVFAFLRCHGFTSSSRVPSTRRFGATRALPSEFELASDLEKQLNVEDTYWAQIRDPDFSELSGWSRVKLPHGTPHNQAIESDSWDENLRIRVIPELRERGIFDSRLNKQELRERFDQLSKGGSGGGGQTLADETITQIKAANPKHGRELLSLFHNLTNPKTGPHALNKIPDDPCVHSEFRIEYLEAFVDDQMLVDMLPGLHESLPDLGEDLTEDHIMHSIAAVVEAIDQLGCPYGDIPTAGLAYAIAGNIALCQMEGDAGIVNNSSLARPRRCWLMPTVVDGALAVEIAAFRRRISKKKIKPGKGREDVQGHIFLAVVQEEDLPSRDGTRFVVTFLDSSQTFFRDVRDFLHTRVIKAAQELGWTDHRNHDRHVRFAPHPRVVQVAYQRNEWACGYHTILNAWILAMGLTPNPHKRFEEDDPLYEELRDMTKYALLGLLDWMTLAAWMICNELVQQQRLENVPPTRRFNYTIYQAHTDDLAARIMRAADEDQILRAFSEDVLPYTRNNVNFSGWPLEGGPNGPDRPNSLHRGYEDFSDEMEIFGGGNCWQRDYGNMAGVIRISATPYTWDDI
ncbi:hypothetical protein P154DRAFT_588402 [Amniculicola lignicola CBS 123094]|uniref:Uncharacterized protein n=1 Tax=Amniculicola lignicola CBS 123094 TaxID=1392246 RepID=A0A6A5VWA0_9PLEO|nr:hypothetical protein P154DRAFT_588402 [Amniculicola lignicola CBS 123094]